MNTCSCLTLILACIVYWQARWISRIAATPDSPFDPEFIARVGPIEWKNVVLYGEIGINPDKPGIPGRQRAFLHESGSYPAIRPDPAPTARGRSPRRLVPPPAPHAHRSRR